MSTYILMKILESAPNRYDRGIRILTLGRLDKAYYRLTSYIKKGERVLDIGCGTGALTIMAALRGAKVKGIDVNSQMLEIARKRVKDNKLEENVELCEQGVAEIGSENVKYDIVMSGLCFSELTDDELNYGLKQIKRILKPGGFLLIADEVVPKNFVKRVIKWIIRLPLIIITYIITQTTTRAVKDLPDKLKKVGFSIESTRLNILEDFIEIVANEKGGV